MSLTIAAMNDPVLIKPAAAVTSEELASSEFQKKIDEMLSIFNNLPAVGLAAPQVGWSKRVFIVGIEAEHGRRSGALPTTVFINPSYEIIDDSKSADWEGCFSVNNSENRDEKHMMGQVNRYAGIRYQALDRDGKLLSGELKNFHARVFQHELDHLDGVRYVNRMANGNLLYFENSENSYKVYMHQLPKVLKNNPQPELVDLVPILRDAPQCGLSKKLLQEIVGKD